MNITPEVLEIMDDVVRSLRNNWQQFTNEDIEDLAHDTLVEFFEAMDVADIGGYLNKAFTQNCKDYDRKNRNRARLEAENALTIRNSTTPSAATNASSSDPMDILQAEQELRARFERLSPLLQKITYLVHVKGMSVARVASELGTTEAAVNMAMTRIKQTFEGNNDDN
jgi:RNA polymerase sigma factor (sigma-70 family)